VLLLKDEPIVLHVFLSIGLIISPDLMQIQAIFICAFLPVHEELTKFASAERG